LLGVTVLACKLFQKFYSLARFTLRFTPNVKRNKLAAPDVLFARSGDLKTTSLKLFNIE